MAAADSGDFPVDFNQELGLSCGSGPLLPARDKALVAILNGVLLVDAARRSRPCAFRDP